MIAFLTLALPFALGIAAILGWAAFSNDDSQGLRPREGTRPNAPVAELHECGRDDDPCGAVDRQSHDRPAHRSTSV